MAQAPATSKFRRTVYRSLAATLGPDWVTSYCALQPSELAALERRANPHRIPVRDPDVVFLIPLVGKHHVDNWERIETRLAATIASIHRQTTDRWRVLICGQDRPRNIAFDERVQFLPFEEKTEGNDKWAKLARLCHALPGVGILSGYAMTFDADDLLGPEAVREMCARRDTGGYLVTHGLIRDAQTGQTGICAPQSLRHPGQKAFWKMCGSCAAWRFDFHEDTRDAEFLAAVTAHEHRMFPYLGRLAGRPLSPMRHTAAMYIVNHGENFGVRRGRVDFKTSYVTRFPVKDPTVVASIEQEFPSIWSEV